MRAHGKHDEPGGDSRRSFLAKLGLGVATIAGASFLFRNFLFSGGTDKPDRYVEEFPGEDSIFHPRRDPRLEARERSKKT